MSNPLSIHPRQPFLAESHVAVVSIPRGHDEAPLCAPVWYSYAPGSELWWITPKPSRKGKLLRVGMPLSFTVMAGPGSARYVSVQGAIVALDEPTTDGHQRPLAQRYLGEIVGAEYADTMTPYNSDSYLIRVRPTHWLSGDLTP